MFKTYFIVLSGLCLLWGCQHTKTEAPQYQYHVNINTIKDDQLSVHLKFIGTLNDTSYFCLPKIVPGIYDNLDYGKFVSQLKAFNAYGKLLDVQQRDTNCWQIIGAKDLTTIEYIVNDGWEAFDFEGIRPYRSSESHFDADALILNTNALFGYFLNHEHVPFKINVKKSDSLYGATSLPKLASSKTEDVFKAPNYRSLVDNPIMYAVADTASIKLPHITIEIAAYSSSKKKIANDIAEFIAPLVKNQTDYLGGNLATDTYTFIIYHNENIENANYFADGLEHNQSTLVLMYAPLDLEILKKNVFQIVSHEFFHTQVPLGLHSHEIANFNFNNPTFSKHLWLYEGMTEYFTIHMPIKQQMQTLEQFIPVIESKIASMNKFDSSISFTELSKHVLKHSNNYMNVYAKGALINLCLDIKLRELSQGAYGIQNLVLDLSEKYGKDNPFHDDDLFKDIYELTGFPEVTSFIENYIEGTQPLPLVETLQKVGLSLDTATGKISEMTHLTENQKSLRYFWISQ